MFIQVFHSETLWKSTAVIYRTGLFLIGLLGAGGASMRHFPPLVCSQCPPLFPGTGGRGRQSAMKNNTNWLHGDVTSTIFIWCTYASATFAKPIYPLVLLQANFNFISFISRAMQVYHTHTKHTTTPVPRQSNSTGSPGLSGYVIDRFIAFSFYSFCSTQSVITLVWKTNLSFLYIFSFKTLVSISLWESPQISTHISRLHN